MKKLIVIALMMSLVACKTKPKKNAACDLILEQEPDAKTHPITTCTGQICMSVCVSTLPNKQKWIWMVSAQGVVQPACLANCPPPPTTQEGQAHFTDKSTSDAGSGAGSGSAAH